jgi:hypothetical protein
VHVKFGSNAEKERRIVKIRNIHENESDSPPGGHHARCEPPIRLRACALPLSYPSALGDKSRLRLNCLELCTRLCA